MSNPVPDPARVTLARASGGYASGAAIAAAVQDVLHRLDLPPDFIRPGDRVVLKPNWIRQEDERPERAGQWDHVITHPAVIEAVAAWAAERLGGTGSVTLCDAPQTDSSFAAIRERCGLDGMVRQLQDRFPGVAFGLLDLRAEEWRSIDGITVARRPLTGDPAGTTVVRLDDGSEFVGFDGLGRLYGASYDMAETNRHHRGARHEYKLARTPMDADVFINLPKLKTHKKVGVTCALKNLVGINADKNWLPHHTEGTVEEGGDQFPSGAPRARAERRWAGAAKRCVSRHPWLAWPLIPAKKVARLILGDTRHVIRSGNWHGNDTCWRMVLDLNKCLFGFGGDGLPLAAPRRYLAVVDGVIGGEGNGPMAPDPVASGVILAGLHPLAVDCAAATLMGFDWTRIPLLREAFNLRPPSFVPFPADRIVVVSGHGPWNGPLARMQDILRFRPHMGWVGAIERGDTP